MKAIGRSYVWWPGLDADIEELARSCDECCRTARAPPRANVIPWSVPSKPWSRIHIDYAGPKFGKTFLVVVDAYSRWIEVEETGGSLTSEITIYVLRKLFSTHGIPDEIVSDNGPAFRSELFAEFLEANLIKHHRVAEYMPASNGLAERAVQTFKRMLEKVRAGSWKKELANVLLSLHCTPCETTGRSPAELLMGRKLRTMLDKLHPYTASVINKKREEKVLSSMLSDSSSRQFCVGDPVWYRNYTGHHKWLAGKIVTVKGPRNYEIITKNGHVIKRHCDQIRSALQINDRRVGAAAVETTSSTRDQREPNSDLVPSVSDDVRSNPRGSGSAVAGTQSGSAAQVTGAQGTQSGGPPLVTPTPPEPPHIAAPRATKQRDRTVNPATRRSARLQTPSS